MSILAVEHRCLFQPKLTPAFLEEDIYNTVTNYLSCGAFGKFHCVDQRVKDFLGDAIDVEISGFSEEVLEERAKLRAQRHHIDGVVWDTVIPEKVRRPGWSQESELYLDSLEFQGPPRFVSLEVYLGVALHLVRSGAGWMLHDYLNVFKHNNSFRRTLMVSALLLERWKEFSIVASMCSGKEQRKNLCRKSYMDAVLARPDSGLWERMERAAFDESTGRGQLFGMHPLIVPLPIRIAWGNADTVRNCLTGRLSGYTEPRTKQIQALLSHPWCRPVVEEIVSRKNLTKYFNNVLGTLSAFLCDYDRELTLQVLEVLQRRVKSLPSNVEQIATEVHQRLLAKTATPNFCWLVQYLIQCPRCVPSLRTFQWKKVMATMEDDLPLAEQTKSLFVSHVGALLPPQDSLAAKLISQMEAGCSPWANEEGAKHLVKNDLVMKVFALAFEHMDKDNVVEVLSQTVSALTTHLFRARRDLPHEEFEVAMDRYVDLCVSLVNDHCSVIAASSVFVEWICYLLIFAVDLTPWQITNYEFKHPHQNEYKKMLHAYPGDDPSLFWVRRRCMVRNGGKLVGLAIFLAVFISNQSLAHTIASSAMMTMGRKETSRGDEDAVVACVRTLDTTKSSPSPKDLDSFRLNGIEPVWSPEAVSLFENNDTSFTDILECPLQDGAVAVMIAMGRGLHRLFAPWLSPAKDAPAKAETGDRAVSRKRKLHHDDHCPITLDPFQVGDEVVVCEGCSLGFSVQAFGECAELYVGQGLEAFFMSLEETLNSSWCCCHRNECTLSRFRVYKLPQRELEGDALPLQVERSSKRVRKE
uniref:Uncharacterized protein n=1 Tax=Palpitomonas bilix TaxID=652834 RepID=A0A7S3GH85_9EUKA|mmetsp:Transcript_49365/g.127263  ORF Transcript_49365/g.127263 Transcript_49365/m.127263 type:complete len:809 (+) Transcript_49365:187-2613(+)